MTDILRFNARDIINLGCEVKGISSITRGNFIYLFTEVTSVSGSGIYRTKHDKCYLVYVQEKAVLFRRFNLNNGKPEGQIFKKIRGIFEINVTAKMIAWQFLVREV
jgi:myo-inositol-hexaphosphate 3-phosphohydrolase